MQPRTSFTLYPSSVLKDDFEDSATSTVGTTGSTKIWSKKLSYLYDWELGPNCTKKAE